MTIAKKLIGVDLESLPDDLIELSDRIEYFYDVYHSGQLTLKERGELSRLYTAAAKKYNRLSGRKAYNLKP